MVAHNAACLDIKAVIIDGNLGCDLLARLQAQLLEQLKRYSWEGVNQPQLFTGTIGADAHAIGGGLLPLHSTFAPDPEIVLKVDR